MNDKAVRSELEINNLHRIAELGLKSALVEFLNAEARLRKAHQELDAAKLDHLKGCEELTAAWFELADVGNPCEMLVIDHGITTYCVNVDVEGDHSHTALTVQKI